MWTSVCAAGLFWKITQTGVSELVFGTFSFLFSSKKMCILEAFWSKTGTFDILVSLLKTIKQKCCSFLSEYSHFWKGGGGGVLIIWIDFRIKFKCSNFPVSEVMGVGMCASCSFQHCLPSVMILERNGLLTVQILHIETQQFSIKSSRSDYVMFRALKKTQWSHQQPKWELCSEETTVIQKAGKVALASLHLFLF